MPARQKGRGPVPPEWLVARVRGEYLEMPGLRDARTGVPAVAGGYGHAKSCPPPCPQGFSGSTESGFTSLHKTHADGSHEP
jgi:hypothetical protein